ncbi:hypothetical protein OLMES_0871 [Oleiphilus messinensis]|uniref:Ergothioneine biosynthesis protein EgtB n=1 Tax=Oleiphilus messinensis TaxID=141451 RepID=A0A1Y0I374_9GAMM|nr:ergothioneine biosynthesis protein EgtB [Oleiphilus messinensis]ARU54958.1 hypothetical protein OLMES_0871 [Oleiphilus messinensis]
MNVDCNDLWQRFVQVRSISEKLAEPLEIEDYCLQAIPETSPIKWHLAHTTWFYETFILKPFLADYTPYHPRFEYLFNSYYNGVGMQFPRPQRGVLSRPTVAEVARYRASVNKSLEKLMASLSEHPDAMAISQRLVLGLNHEQQHQELMLTDLKYNLSLNPLYPVYNPAPLAHAQPVPGARYIDIQGGYIPTGVDASANAFCFDNETPRHERLIQPFSVADRLVTQGEYLEFIQDGGYQNPLLWLADGWAEVQQQKWCAPLYWVPDAETTGAGSSFSVFTLHGLQDFDPNLPVVHISYYEADAFARWAGARLLREDEWEMLATAQCPTIAQCPTTAQTIKGNFFDPQRNHPVGLSESLSQNTVQQLYGDTWEWTQSPYQSYPGYRAAEGAIGEYNGKFMCNQLVLRGGSIATPQGHIRATYRNFFYPADRWQFSGLRLAR